MQVDSASAASLRYLPPPLPTRSPSRSWNHNCTDGHSSWCDYVTYAEYGSVGPGADAKDRVWWSHQLTAAEAAKWTPAFVLRGWEPTPPPTSGSTSGLRQARPGGQQ